MRPVDSFSPRTSALGFRENEPVAQFEMGSGRNLVYLILDWTVREAMVIDPTSDLQVLLEPLKQHNFKLTGILLTHTHWDHVGGVSDLMAKNPSAPLYVHTAELFRLKKQRITSTHPALREIKEGSRIPHGCFSIEVLHTPGHSAGACCFLVWMNGVPLGLFTGDTFFVGDCGRTDLDTGSSSAMFSSIQKAKELFHRLQAQFPGHSVATFPGHHYGQACTSTLAREVKSPPFLCQSVEELEKLP